MLISAARFFFSRRRRHTRCLSDWSSDVCSSDLALAKSGLRQRGFDVVAVESGEQALDILKKNEPPVDLVVLDLTMPGLSGEKVLRAIRRSEERRVGKEGRARGSPDHSTQERAHG